MAKLVKGVNDLATIYPDIAEEWDPEANGFGPDDVTPGSQKRVIWVCGKGHHYSAMILNKTKKRTGCPYCSGRLPIKGRTDLQTIYPDLAEEWDYERNEKGPDEYCVSSGKEVYWVCKKEKHSFKAQIHNRTRGHGCPYCSGRLPIKGKTDLQTMRPDLAEEWDYKRNEKGPDEYTYASNQMVYWVCKKEKHSFKAQIHSRTRGNGCPYCSGRLPIKGKTDLQTVYPDLAEEWDYERNEKGPDEYTYASKQMVYWVCEKEGHSFKSRIFNRTRGRGCPYCNRKK